MRPLLRLAVLLLASCVTLASAQSGPVARIPVQIVQGRLLVRCDVSTIHRRLPVNLFVELETKCGLELHNQAAAGLRCENEDGSTIPITLHFGSLDLVVDQREHGDEEYLKEFTKWNSIEMGETAVVGKLGSDILADYHLTFDLDSGMMEVRGKADKTDSPPAPEPGQIILPMNLSNGQCWLTVRHGEGKPYSMALGTAEYDSTIDEILAESLGFPAGDIGELELGEIGLHEFLALRPVELNQKHVDETLGVLGLNFLEAFRVSIDRVNERLTLERTAKPEFPDEDLAFFRAMVEEEPEPLVEYLNTHGETRLAREAATLLLDLAIDYGANEAEFRTALEWIDKTTPEDLRCTSTLDQMKRLKEANLPEALVLAGEIGLPAGRKDRYPDAVHKIHAGMGRVLLESEDNDRAWSHLLSAAFGMKEDGRVNLDLGRFYERQGRLRRAESRFIQALIQAESGAEAFEGLARVRDGLGDAEPLSFDEIEKRVEGKVLGFGAATTYEPKESEELAPGTQRHVALVELFVNPNLERAGQQGGILAFEGLRRHFEGHAAFLTYHMPEPELVPLANEFGDEVLFAYELERPGTMMLDGVSPQPGACRDHQIQELYDAVQPAVAARLEELSLHSIEFAGKVEGTQLSGSMTVQGPAQGEIVLQVVLAERGVLFPGRAGAVLHRMVARGGLTAPITGIDFAPDDTGAHKVEFSCDTKAVTAANLAWLNERAEAGLGLTGAFGTEIDPRQLALVGIVRDAATREVLQAVEFIPEGAEPEQR